MTVSQARKDFSDIHKLGEAVASAGYDGQYTQTHPGRIDIQMTISEFAALTVVHEKVSIGVEFFGSPPPGHVTFMFVEHGPGLFVNGGTRNGGRLYLAGAGSEMHCITGGVVEVFSISGPFQMFADLLEDRKKWVRGLALAQVMPIPMTDHQANDLAWLLRRTLMGIEPGYADQIEEALVDRLRELLAHNDDRDAMPSPRELLRHQEFRRARNFILEHLDDHISSADLVNQVAMTERSLQRVFRQETGLTPREYIRINRLNAARRHIIESASPRTRIHAIAFDNGFTHTGRFSREFREHFGVLPSVFLKQQARAHRAAIGKASAS